MGALIPFAYGDALVRVIEINAAPWWVAGDVVKVLGYSHTPHMLRQLDADEQGVHNVDGLEGERQVSREVTIISESGLYHAILKSRRQEAKAFRKWVTSDVLPTVRQRGFYAAPSPAPILSARPFRKTRGWLSSLDRLAISCGSELDWVRAALRGRIASQVDILAEFNRRIAAKGEKPVSKSAFNRFAVNQAIGLRRLEEELAITREVLSRMGPGEQADALLAAAQVIRAKVVESVSEGDLNPRQNQLAALALERLSGVIERAEKSCTRRHH